MSGSRRNQYWLDESIPALPRLYKHTEYAAEDKAN